MAKKKTADAMIAYRFPPGKSGNPAGRPPGRPTFKKASPEAFARIVDAYLYGGPDALGELFRAEDATPNELFIISVIKQAAQKGDSAALGQILDRFVGRPKERIEVKAEAPAAAGLSLSEINDDELAARRALLDEAGK